MAPVLPCGRARASWSRVGVPGSFIVLRIPIRTARGRPIHEARRRGRGLPRKPPCSAGRACSRTPGRRRARDRATRTTNSHNARSAIRIGGYPAHAIRSPDPDPKCNEIKILLPHAEQRSIRLGNKIQVPTVPKRNLQPLGKMQQRCAFRGGRGTRIDHSYAHADMMIEGAHAIAHQQPERECARTTTKGCVQMVLWDRGARAAS